MTTPDYVLTTDAEEIERLGFQHRLWSDTAYALWRRAGLKRGDRVLDLGCGPGYASFDLAELVGSAGEVLAIDSAERFLTHLRAQQAARAEAGLALPQLRAEQQDVAFLDLPQAHFDSVFCRWVLCWVPDPEAAIASVAQALRPGGAFVVQDYFNYRAMSFGPRWPRFEKVIEAIVASWRANGGDEDFAARLPGYCLTHGLEVEEIRPIVHTVRGSDALWDWPGSFWKSFVPHLVEDELLDPQLAEDFLTEWKARRGDPASFFFTPPVVEFIARKPA